MERIDKSLSSHVEHIGKSTCGLLRQQLRESGNGLTGISQGVGTEVAEIVFLFVAE